MYPKLANKYLKLANKCSRLANKYPKLANKIDLAINYPEHGQYITLKGAEFSAPFVINVY